jgi:hypothetical protein
MAMNSSHALAIFAALALGALPSAGHAAKPDGQNLIMSAANKHRTVPHRRNTQERQIACTRGGCVTVPPGCHPVVAFDFFGNPTGYDAIFCPGSR